MKFLVFLLGIQLHAADTIVSAGADQYANGAALQAAINAADCGDRVILPAGFVYSMTNTETGHYLSLPLKSTAACNAGTSYVDIQSENLASLPAGRVGLSDVANMPKITVMRGVQQVIGVENQAHHYRLQGLEITSDPNVITIREIAYSQVGSFTTVPALTPHDIIIDRCVLHPGAEAGTPFRAGGVGVNMEGVNWTISNSYIYDYQGSISQAAAAPITAGTNAFPAVVTSTHGKGASGWFWMWVDGATGSWTPINGFNLAMIVDSTHFRPAQWVYTLDVAGSKVTATTGYTRPHGFSSGQTVYIDGVTYSGATSLNGSKTITVTGPNTFTFTNSGAADGQYCGTDTPCQYRSSDQLGAIADSTSWGSLTGTVKWREESPWVSVGLQVNSSIGPFRYLNNYIAAWYSAFFTGGGALDPQYTATMSNVAAGSATLSNTTELRVGDYVTIDTDYTNYLHGYRVAQIQTISGSEVTFKGLGPNRLANAATDYDTGTCATTGTSVTLSGFNVSNMNPYTVYYRGVPININGTEYTLAGWSDSTHVTLTASAGTQSGVPCAFAMLPKAGGSMGWRGVPGPIMEVRGNTFDKPASYLQNSRLCKGAHEMKLWNGGIIDGNIYTGEACETLSMTMHNQVGNSPWSTFRNWTYSNNLVLNAERAATIAAMDDYLATVAQMTNLPPGFEYGNGGGFVNNNIFLDDTWTGEGAGFNLYVDASIWTHNTQRRTASTTSKTIELAGCPYTSALPALCNTSVFKDNMVSQGYNGIQAAYWPTFSTAYVNNLIVDEYSRGYPPANNISAPNWAAVGFSGTCNTSGSNWLNCTAGNYAGRASDGGTPGADVKQINDHINGWSEQAGLIVFSVSDIVSGFSNSPSAFSLAQTTATMTFTIFNPVEQCSLKLYTNMSRTVLHADTAHAGLQACSRTGNTVGGPVSFQLGNNSALSARTDYYYELSDGPRVMTGHFRTLSSGSASLNSVVPASGLTGATTIPISIAGVNTNFKQGVTSVSFGAGVSVSKVAVADESHLRAFITIDATAGAGVRTVVVTTSGEVVNGAFTVVAPLPSAAVVSVLPSSIAQGSASEVQIVGSNTHFSQGATTVSFGTGITTSSVGVTDGTHLTAPIIVSESATPGPRVVMVVTGAEQVSAVGMFSVVSSFQSQLNTDGQCLFSGKVSF